MTNNRIAEIKERVDNGLYLHFSSEVDTDIKTLFNRIAVLKKALFTVKTLAHLSAAEFENHRTKKGLVHTLDTIYLESKYALAAAEDGNETKTKVGTSCCMHGTPTDRKCELCE